MFRRSAAVVHTALLGLAMMGLASRAEDKPVHEVRHYLGESKMITPDGKPIRTSVVLAKRVVNQAAGRIEEHVLSVNEKDSRAFVVVQKVKGNKFTLTERAGSFSGEGELVGEAWKWKGWNSVTRLAGGAGTVTSEDRVTDQGLSVRKSFAGAEGKVLFRFEESLRPIGAKTYDILHARLAPAGTR